MGAKVTPEQRSLLTVKSEGTTAAGDPIVEFALLALITVILRTLLEALA